MVDQGVDEDETAMPAMWHQEELGKGDSLHLSLSGVILKAVGWCGEGDRCSLP